MKVFSVLILLSFNDWCFGRSVEPATIKERFRRAKYAFKFRVISETVEECFDATVSTTTVKTTDSSTAPTPTTAFAKETTQKTSNSSDHRQTPIINEISSKPTLDISNKLSGKTAKPTALEVATVDVKITNLKTKSHTESQNHNVFSTTVYVPASTVTPNQGNVFSSMPADNTENRVNSTESVGQGRRKRSCDYLIRYQRIRIGRKHIYKGCKEINKMNRVEKMNPIYLKSAVRLQMGYKGKKENRNYFFMGREVPGEHPDDYVFMADELTVVKWKPKAWKLKKYFRSNGERCD
ncbi:uncharacterized protein LOC114518961 [Dendronephthya gigantea]|uniref:uncharacterized protein LOC114518961 n=1 Tax=Dendronephthya gigantea TaxID=151771 RepID=UPI00106BBAFD|nr:uncharacterized protein LOC114518961 [Dendronephthya gigantea]